MWGLRALMGIAWGPLYTLSLACLQRPSGPLALNCTQHQSIISQPFKPPHFWDFPALYAFH